MFNQAEHKERILGMLDMIRIRVENSAAVAGSFNFNRPDLIPHYGYGGPAFTPPLRLKTQKQLTITMELDLILGENKG